MHRRTLLKAAGMALATCTTGRAFAASYPSRPITLWVPYAVGGNGDLTARIFAQALSSTIGHPVIVANKPGAGGAIGAMYVVRSRPDGYTLLFSAPSVFSVLPHLVKTEYGPSNIKPLFLVSKTPLVLVVGKKSRFKSLADLVQAAKSNPEAIPMGYSGLGTPNHLAMLDLETVGKIRFNGIAYNGSGPMLQDMLAGTIEVGADQISTSTPYIKSGNLIPLAVFGPPLSTLPGVPSVSSIGPEPFDVTTYLGVSGPVGLPDTVAATLQHAARAAIKTDLFVKRMAQLGSLVHWGSDADYKHILQTQDKFMRQMIASGRIKHT